MSSEERLRQSAQLGRVGLSYVERLKRRGGSGLGSRPALTRGLAGLLRQGESVLLVGHLGTGRRSLVLMALQELLGAEPVGRDSDLASVIRALMDGQPGEAVSPEQTLPPAPLLDIVEAPVSTLQVEAIYVGELETKVAVLQQVINHTL